MGNSGEFRANGEIVVRHAMPHRMNPTCVHQRMSIGRWANFPGAFVSAHGGSVAATWQLEAASGANRTRAVRRPLLKDGIGLADFDWASYDC